jgi:hypothetical protein
MLTKSLTPAELKMLIYTSEIALTPNPDKTILHMRLRQAGYNEQGEKVYPCIFDEVPQKFKDRCDYDLCVGRIKSLSIEAQKITTVNTLDLHV